MALAACSSLIRRIIGVRKVDPAGRITTVVGSGVVAAGRSNFSGDGGPAVGGQLDNPRDLAINRNGDLLIADASNNRVRLVESVAVAPPLLPPLETSISDFDGNGTTDVSVFHPSTGTWFIQGGPSVSFGTSGDLPVPGDYNGDGKTDLAVFRPSTGTWFIQGGPSVSFGTSGDRPLPVGQRHCPAHQLTPRDSWPSTSGDYSVGSSYHRVTPASSSRMATCSAGHGGDSLGRNDENGANPESAAMAVRR